MLGGNENGGFAPRFGHSGSKQRRPKADTVTLKFSRLQIGLGTPVCNGSAHRCRIATGRAYRRLHWLLCREGWTMNHKKFRWLIARTGYRCAAVASASGALGTPAPMTIPQGPNQRWSLDFVYDAFVCGRRPRISAVIDDYSRDCMRLNADTSMSGARVGREIAAAVFKRMAWPLTIESFDARLAARMSQRNDLQQPCLCSRRVGSLAARLQSLPVALESGNRTGRDRAGIKRQTDTLSDGHQNGPGSTRGR